MTSTLTGIGDSPIPRVAREFAFAQGSSVGAGTGREVVLVGNKTSDGTETVTTLGTAILSQADCDARFGARSEIRWMYAAFVSVDQGATIKAIAVVESAGTAASVTFTFVTAASALTTMFIDWGGFRLQVTVNSGDTAVTQCAAAVARINAEVNLPFSAAQGSGGNTHIMTLTASNIGPRGDFLMTAVRVSYFSNVTTTCTKASITSGTTADTFTLALAQLARTEIYYHVAACTASSGVTTTDGGVGEYIEFLRTQVSPANGKEQIAHFGLDCTQGQATTVATSSAANSVFAKFFRVKGNDIPPWMVAAINCAAHSIEERKYAAANMSGYTTSDSTKYPIPDPFDKSNRPSTTEIAADLNNGVCAIAFSPNGQSSLVRSVTSKSWTGSSTTKDYRAREGHIPSVTFAFWAELEARYIAQRQPNVAADPPQGVRPVPGCMYPLTLKGIVGGVMDDMCGPFMNNMPLLDSSVIADMRASISVELNPAGFFTRAIVQPVRHDLFDDFLISQAGPAY